MRSVIHFEVHRLLRRTAGHKYRASCHRNLWFSTATRQWSTPLAKQLSEAIRATGPIPLATFMRMCLTSDVGGYYMSSQVGKDQFGRKGDFITSPEISQIFGELIGLWFVAEWMAQGRRRKGVDLIEIGPGRGTLIDDILRTIRNFKSMSESIEAVYLVEASPSLREAQKKLLCDDAPMEEMSIGHRSVSKYSKLPIIWTENIRSIPSDHQTTPFIVAHEFFDALPIHVFQATAPSITAKDVIQTPTGQHKFTPAAARSWPAEGPQWREMLVSPIPPGSTYSTLDKSNPRSLSDLSPEFQLALSQASTQHSRYLPEISARYRALKSTPGSVIEISPESQVYAGEIARRIGGTHSKPKPKPSGAALILDYGPENTIPTDSLRGIRQHQRVSPFSAPGLVDISADVDFVALAEAALMASPQVEVHGPVEQGAFLLRMGIQERAHMLLNSLVSDAKKQQRIQSAWRRLVDRGGAGMGRVYKVMAILPEARGRKPVGFGGDVSL